MTDQAIAHLEQENDRLKQQVAQLKDAYQDADRKSSLKGWAIDRAIRVAEINKDSLSVEDLKKYADQLVEYCEIVEVA